MKENYNFIYHYNTYSKLWGAMAIESVGHYFNADSDKGDFALGNTRKEARDLLTKKLSKCVTN